MTTDRIECVKIKFPQKSLSVFVPELHPDIIQYVLFTLATSTFFSMAELRKSCSVVRQPDYFCLNVNW